MPGRSRAITWVVGRDGAKDRAICFEATAPARIKSFVRRHPHTHLVVQPFGKDHIGKELSETSLKALTRGLQRHRKNANTEAAIAALRADDRVGAILDRVARQHGIDRTCFRSSQRSPRLSRARGHAAHDLRRVLNLGLGEIASALNLRQHSSVAYWLSKPYEDVARPGRPCP